MDESSILHYEKKSKIRHIFQKLFLELLKYIFGSKFQFYKNKIKLLMSKIRLKNILYLKTFILRFKYPLYFKLPARHLYGIDLLIRFSNFFELNKINFFIIGGTLLGAARQGSFAGRPTDIDIGIIESESFKLTKLISSMKKDFKPQIIRKTSNEKLQFIFAPLLFDITIYKKKKINKKVFWVNKKDFEYNYINPSVKKKKIVIFTENDLKKLVNVKLYVKNFLAPSNINLYLKKKYGKNWRKPNKKQFVWKRIK